MFHHETIDTTEFGRKRKLKSLIDSGEIVLAGNSSLKIYGTLDCYSGKRMKRKTRVFFKSAAEAISVGYRPCGHCMKDEYKKWKSNNMGA